MKDQAKDLMRYDRGALEDALRQAGAEFASGAKVIKCPFHPDSSPSATIHESDGRGGGPAGVWKFHCFTCGIDLDYWDVLAKAQNRPVADLLRHEPGNQGPNSPEKAISSPIAGSGGIPASSGPQSGATSQPAPSGEGRQFRKIEDVKTLFGSSYQDHYAYTDPATGKVDLLVVRFMKQGKKCFAQYHQDAPGGQFFAGGVTVNPLFNRTQMAKEDTVLVVEGEKDVKTLRRLGFCATTWPGGANATGKVDWSPLSGKKRVILWPDNDLPGMKAMARALEALQELDKPPAEILRVNPEWLGLGAPAEKHGADVTDWLELNFSQDSGETKHAMLREVLATQVESTGPASEVMAQLEDVISGRRRMIYLMHPEVSTLTQAFLPGSITILCGSPGNSKSLWSQEIMMTLHRRGEPVAILAMEHARPFHMRRALAQLAGVSELTDEEWVKQNAAEAKSHLNAWKAQIDSFGQTITCCPAKGRTQAEIVAWSKKMAQTGKKVICIDPITKARRPPGAYAPDADLDFMNELKTVAEEHECCLFLITHPKGGKFGGGDPMSNMSGGAAYERFAQTIFWLEFVQDPRPTKISHGGQIYTTGDDYEPCNRVLQICKANNGRGKGAYIGFNFDGRTLRSKELGVIQKEAKKRAFSFKSGA